MVPVIFFAIIAGFIIFKLVEILGKEEGDEQEKILNLIKESAKSYTKEAQTVDFEVLTANEANLSEDIREVFSKFKSKEKNLSVDNFLDGTKKAFELILQAFNSNNKKDLKNLLAENLYKDFSQEIDNRKDSKLIHQVTLVSIANVKILEASFEKNSIATVKVRIHSEQIKVVKNTEDEILDGNIHKILKFSDVWVFKKILNEDSYWRLVETYSE
ncbi:MAG: putative lipid-binding transport protein (Tim44 family) [Candidatus Midichloriaceae bacterium]|jgi:predicted lipid-binding transport protein (Tim44 family)